MLHRPPPPSHGVLPGPLLGQLLVLLLVSLVQSEVKLTNSNLVFEVSDVSLLTLQFLAPEDHLGWDRRAMSRLREALWRW